MGRRGKGGPAKFIVPIVNVVGLIAGLVGGLGGKGKRKRRRGRDVVRRACIECTEVYTGGLDCPACGAPGEPLDEDR